MLVVGVVAGVGVRMCVLLGRKPNIKLVPSRVAGGGDDGDDGDEGVNDDGGGAKGTTITTMDGDGENTTLMEGDFGNPIFDLPVATRLDLVTLTLTLTQRP